MLFDLTFCVVLESCTDEMKYEEMGKKSGWDCVMGEKGKRKGKGEFTSEVKVVVKSPNV